MKKIYIIHTSLVSHSELMGLFSEIIPEAKVFNIVDDSLLHDVMQNGGINENIISRMCKYFEAAANNGADLIFNQCSSVGEASDIAAKLVNMPVVKVDEAMAEKAVELGRKIAVVATVKSTMKPSCNLVRTKAEKAGKAVEVVEYLVDGALDVLMKEKNREKHNALVLEMVKKAEAECDVIVLAQGSMTVLLSELKDIKKPVLTSPRMGVEKARMMLFGGLSLNE
ncbi:MAG TPA: aspartate/glutamate racemase family protein [Patescibacteria group bacterium]|nr:aspartate/glutamate racemase family protein [Patescibacteria group bacterium]